MHLTTHNGVQQNKKHVLISFCQVYLMNVRSTPDCCMMELLLNYLYSELHTLLIHIHNCDITSFLRLWSLKDVTHVVFMQLVVTSCELKLRTDTMSGAWFLCHQFFCKDLSVNGSVQGILPQITLRPEPGKGVCGSGKLWSENSFRK